MNTHKIDIAKNSSTGVLEITFAPLLLKQSLFLNKQGQFDVEKIKSSENDYLKAVQPDGIKLSISGIEGIITLQPDGSMIMGSINSKDNVQLKTCGNIVIDGPVDTNALTLQAKNMYINDLIHTKSILSLEADELLQNNHAVEAKRVEINGSGKFENTGLVSAKKLRIGITSLENSGALLAEDLRAEMKQSGTRMKDAQFKNEGIILGNEGLSLHVHGDMVNQGSGEIVSSKRVIIRTRKTFENTAKIYSKGELAIYRQKAFRNSGLITAEETVQISTEGLFDNSGILQSLKNINLKANHFLNNQKGTFNAESLSIYAEQDFTNEGLMQAETSALITCPGPIHNKTNAKIISNAKVFLEGGGKLINEGVMTGHHKVSTRALNTFNDKNAKINADEVSVDTLGEFYNKGDTIALELLNVQAKTLYNAEDARLGSDGRANINVHSIATNLGNIFAKNLTLQASSLINEIRTGDISALETLRATIKNLLANGHRITAKNIIMRAKELHNLEAATIEGTQKVNIFAVRVFNHGKIISMQLFLRAAEKFCNNKNAQLAASKCLKLISEGVLENESEISSEGTALLKAVLLLVNNLEGRINANQWAKLISAYQIENAGEIKAEGDLLIKALSEFNNLTEGKVNAENIRVKANAIRNRGLLAATKKLSLEAKWILDNLLRGIILAGEKLELFSKTILENAGTLDSKGTLLLKAGEILKNLKEAKVVATEDLQLLAGHVLSNAGHLFSNKDMLLKSGHWISNGLEAHIQTEGNLNIEADYSVDNEGSINAKGSMVLKALEVLQNHQQGVLNAEAAVLSAAKVISNFGEMHSEDKLSVESELILNNYQDGKISSKEALQLYSACIVSNAGTVTSLKDITLKADTLVQTLAQSKVESTTQLNLLSQFAIENAGALKAHSIHIKATTLFNNLLGSEVAALDNLETEARYTENAGELHSNLNLTTRGQALWNLRTGKITAAETLKVFLSGYGENEGLIGAKAIELDAQSFTNKGQIVGLKTICLKIQDIFKHTTEGLLSAEEAIILLAKDLRFVGQLMAKGDFSATIERDFEYNPETLWACGLLKLMLKQGFDFTKPIKTPGSLAIHTDRDIQIHAPVQGDKDVSVNARNLNVQSNGIFASAHLKINTQDSATLKQNTYLASNEGMSVKAKTIHNDLGEIYTCADLLLEALSLIENSGNISVEGNATLIAPLFQHHILTRTNYAPRMRRRGFAIAHSMEVSSTEALSAQPIMSVSGNCTLPDTQIVGGVLGVGGQLNTQGNKFEAYSFEAYRTWYETYVERGGRNFWGHRSEHVHSVLRRQTVAVYPSQVSAGVAANVKVKHFGNGGAFSTPIVDIAQFRAFYNGNLLLPTAEVMETEIPLRQFFKESTLFGASKDAAYVYGPKLPLRWNTELAQPVQVGLKNPVAKALFAPIIEQKLLQEALYKIIRRGYINNQAGSPEAVLAQTRQNTYDLFCQLAGNPNIAGLTLRINEQVIAAFNKAAFYYCGQEPYLHFPLSLKTAISMGNANEATFRAEQAVLKGSEGSIVHNTGRIKIDNHCNLQATTCINEQRSHTEQRIVNISRKAGQGLANQVSAVSGTGIIEAGTLDVDCNNWTQVGGSTHSGPGGTHLVVRDAALIKALRTTEVHQREVTRKGVAFEIEPHFIAAKISSLGSQSIIVTHGPLTAIGMHSTARGLNEIKTKYDTHIQHAYETYNLATMKTRKYESGGTSFSALPSILQGSEVKVQSEASNVTLIHTLLYSTGDVTFKAKKVIKLLNALGETSAYSHSRRNRGFQHVRQTVEHAQSHVLRTEWSILGNLLLEAEDEIRLKSVRGLTLGDLRAQTREAVLEGDTETESIITKTKTLGLSFCGSEALEKMMQGKNSGAALKSFLTEDRFIAALNGLAEAKENSDRIISAAQTFVEGWRLANLVGHACNEIGTDGTQGDLLGSLTDRWGLTTSSRNANGLLERKFNPKFTLSYSISTAMQEFICVIPTTLMIGGDLHIVADIVKILDGTQIEAQNISIIARQLLQIHAAKNTHQSSMSQRNASLSVRADGSFDGMSMGYANHHGHSVQYANVHLKARNLLDILSDKVAVRGAELRARNVAIRTVELILESLQDTHEASGSNASIALGSNAPITNVQGGSQGAHQQWTNHPSFIHAEQTLDLFIDYLTQTGAVLKAELVRVQGLHQDKPLNWHYSDLQDTQSSHNTQIKLDFNGKNDSFPLTGSLKLQSTEKTGITRATVSGLALNEHAPTGINKDLNQVQQVFRDKKTDIGIPFVVPNENLLTPMKKQEEIKDPQKQTVQERPQQVYPLKINKKAPVKKAKKPHSELTVSELENETSTVLKNLTIVEMMGMSFSDANVFFLEPSRDGSQKDMIFNHTLPDSNLKVIPATFQEELKFKLEYATAKEQRRNAAVAAGLASDALGLFHPIVSHATYSFAHVKSILGDGIKINRSRPWRAFGNAFYVSEEGYSCQQVLLKDPKYVLTFKMSNKTPVIDYVPPGDTGQFAIEAEKKGFAAIKRKSFYTKPNGEHVYNFAVKDPKWLTPTGVYSAPNSGRASAISIYTIRGLQWLGAAGTIYSAGYAINEIAHSENPVLETAYQTSVFAAAIAGGKVAIANSLIPCSYVGELFPPAAPYTVPFCMLISGAGGAYMASKGVHTGWQAAETKIRAEMNKPAVEPKARTWTPLRALSKQNNKFDLSHNIFHNKNNKPIDELVLCELFERQSVLDNDSSIGWTDYAYGEVQNSHLQDIKEKIQLSTSIGLGVNIGTAKTKTKWYESQVDANLSSAEGGVYVDLNMSTGKLKIGAGVHGVLSAASVKGAITNRPITMGNTKIQCTLAAEAHGLGAGYSVGGSVDIDATGNKFKGKAGVHLGAVVPPWGGLVLSMQCAVEPKTQPLPVFLPPSFVRP